MVQRVTADDLLFATVRARWLDTHEHTAADLLDAAAHPERLDGITAAQARAEAGVVLIDGGQPAQAIGILRGVIQDADPATAAWAQVTLAMALGETGDGAGAESMAESSISAGSDQVIARIFVARSLVRGGDYERAQRLADDAVAAARAAQERGIIKKLAIRQAGKGREKVYEEVRLARQGSALDAPGVRAAAAHSLDEPAWPVVTNGTLLWWPETEYQRLIRDLPELGDVLGETWPAHTARVDKELQCATQVAARRVSLISAEFTEFVNFITEENADPRAASTMTAYGLNPSRYSVTPWQHRKPVNWPPRRRQPCWCGSGRRYHDCHRANGSE
jgi:hypothetical protein